MHPYIPTSRQVIFWEPGVSGGAAVAPPEPTVTDPLTWAPKETQIAVYNLLTNDSDLMTLLGTTIGGTQKVFDFVPENLPFPFVTMSIKPWEDRGNYTYEGFKCTLQIDVWYQPGGDSRHGLGDLRVQLIQQRIDFLMHKKYLSVRGWNTLVLRRALIDILTDPDSVTKHGIQQFKLFLGGQ